LQGGICSFLLAVEGFPHKSYAMDNNISFRHKEINQFSLFFYQFQQFVVFETRLLKI
jgi:hypothetical protein